MPLSIVHAVERFVLFDFVWRIVVLYVECNKSRVSECESIYDREVTRVRELRVRRYRFNFKKVIYSSQSHVSLSAVPVYEPLWLC